MHLFIAQKKLTVFLDSGKQRGRFRSISVRVTICIYFAAAGSEACVASERNLIHLLHLDQRSQPRGALRCQARQRCRRVAAVHAGAAQQLTGAWHKPARIK